MSYLTVNPIVSKINLWQNSPINLLLVLQPLGPYNHEIVVLKKTLLPSFNLQENINPDTKKVSFCDF